LQITNTSTNSSAAPLALVAGKGRPPLTTNSSVKVTNLNADELDGIDSRGFVQGKGSVYGNAFTLPPSSPAITVTVVPNFIAVRLSCDLESDGGTFADSYPDNIGSTAENVYDNAPGVNAFDELVQPDTSGQGFGAESGGELVTYSVQGSTVAGGPQTVSTITIGQRYRDTSNDCQFQIQATTGHQ
jgi:hypothetical protein